MTGEPQSSGHVVVGKALSRDGEKGEPVGVPVSEINRHCLVAGTTGAGKSVTGIHSTVSAYEATDGTVIAIDPKGDWAQQLARTKHARTGTLDDVTYFDVAEFLPQVSFFDVRKDVAVDRDRGKVVRHIADHFLTIIDHLLPESAEAVRAPDVLRYLIIALFDPVEGDDAYGIDELVTAVYQLRRNRTVPDVSTEWGERLLSSITDGTSQMFDGIAQGVATRVEKIYGSGYLRPLFGAVPDDADDAFQFDDYLQDNQMLIFDLGGLPRTGKQVVANVLLSLLWRAAQRRHAHIPDESRKQTIALIDEVPQLRIEQRLQELLALSRGYNLGFIAMMQYPKQLQEKSGSEAYTEVLNNCNSFLVGRVPEDAGLASRLSSYAMSEGELANRLTNIPLDRWYFQPATPRGKPRPGTHMIADLPLPQGHPEAEGDAIHPDLESFQEDFATCLSRTNDQFGVSPDAYTADAVVEQISPNDTLPDDVSSALATTNYAVTLPLVESLPNETAFDPAHQSIVCTRCGATYPSSFDGLLDALKCHGDASSIDRDAIPPVTLDLPLTATEIRKQPLSTRQLIALQILHNLTTDRYDRREVDLVFDPLQAVFERLGISSSTLRTLEDKGYITIDELHRYVYYTITPEGREAINASHRRGASWGHSRGDLTETTLHIAMVRALARYFEETFVSDPDHPIEEVVPYYGLSPKETQRYDIHGNTRFDMVGLDAEGEIVGIGEAERLNNDRATAAIRDYDQIAAINPEEAVWVVPSSKAGHKAVLQPLANPSEVADEIEDTSQRIPEYSESTRIPTITGINTDGMTEIHTLNELRKKLTEPTLEL